MKFRTIHALVALAAVCAVAILGGRALAVTSSSAAAADAVIHACKHPNGGWVRIIEGTASCRSREQAVNWNQAASGGGGITQLSELAGIACTTEGGAAGKVELDYAGDDTVLFRCTAGGAPPPSATKLAINEVDYDQVGADGDGFVELKKTGTAAVDLTGIVLVFVDGADGEEYKRTALTGTLAAGGYLVVASDPQNGAPDGLALIDSAGALIDALSYEGSIASALIGTKTYNLVEGTVLPATVVDSNTTAGSLIRNPDGRDTNNAASDWVFTKTLTRNAANISTPTG
jgi:hypothetical protein